MKIFLPRIRTTATAGTLALIISLGFASNLKAADEAAKKKVKTTEASANLVTTEKPALRLEGKRAAAVTRLAPGRAVGEAVPNDSATANLLRQAYGSLAAADHDYDGHRAKAMHEIEAAAKRVGISLHGDGKDRIAQGPSDTLLLNAAGLLDQASTGLRGQSFQHVKQAYAQLDVALRVR